MRPRRWSAPSHTSECSDRRAPAQPPKVASRIRLWSHRSRGMSRPRPRACRSRSGSVICDSAQESDPQSRTPTSSALARFPRRRWLHRASGVASVRVWCRVNVHPPCQVVNTLCRNSFKNRCVFRRRSTCPALEREPGSPLCLALKSLSSCPAPSRSAGRDSGGPPSISQASCR